MRACMLAGATVFKGCGIVGRYALPKEVSYVSEKAKLLEALTGL